MSISNLKMLNFNVTLAFPIYDSFFQSNFKKVDETDLVQYKAVFIFIE